MKKLIALLAIAAAAAVLVAMNTGCAQTGPHSGCDYFQRTRGHQAHSQNDRIYNPNDYRYNHERHETGIDSHTND